MRHERNLREGGLMCPTCRSTELQPRWGGAPHAGHKAEVDGHWWSQCLVCSGCWFKQRLFGIMALVERPDQTRDSLNM